MRHVLLRKQRRQHTGRPVFLKEKHVTSLCPWCTEYRTLYRMCRMLYRVYKTSYRMLYRLYRVSYRVLYWRRQWHPTPAFLPGESQGEPGGLPSMGSHRVRHD